LRRDARQSLTALSKAVNLSRTAVQARIARLEREQVITGYRAVVAEPAGAETLGAVLSVVVSRHPCRPVVETFRDWPEIAHYYSVTGPVDAFIVVRVKNAQELSQVIHRLSGLDGVASVGSAVLLAEGFDD